MPVYQFTFCSAGSGVGLPVGYGTANILTSSSAMLTEIGLRDFSIRRWRERCFITIQIWHERSYIFLYNISDSKARSMQESRINVQVSPKLAITPITYHKIKPNCMYTEDMWTMGLATQIIIEKYLEENGSGSRQPPGSSAQSNTIKCWCPSHRRQGLKKSTRQKSVPVSASTGLLCFAFFVFRQSYVC